MMLVVDAGNSRLKWAVRLGAAWRARGTRSAGDLAGLAEDWLAWQPTQVGVSCVACPSVEAALRVELERMAGLSAGYPTPAVHWLVSPAAGHGVVNAYAQPARLGSDRFALLVACQGMGLSPCLVISAGTAVTMDVLAGDGRHLGGIILPGLGLMRAALDQGTARVTVLGGRVRELPTCTEDGVETGLMLALSGAARELARQFQDRPGGAGPLRILVTGGDADALAAALAGAGLGEVGVMPDLVLEGLARIVQAGEHVG